MENNQPNNDQAVRGAWINATERWPNKAGFFRIKSLRTGKMDTYYIGEVTERAKQIWDKLAHLFEWWDRDAIRAEKPEENTSHNPSSNAQDEKEAKEKHDLIMHIFSKHASKQNQQPFNFYANPMQWMIDAAEEYASLKNIGLLGFEYMYEIEKEENQKLQKELSEIKRRQPMSDNKQTDQIVYVPTPMSEKPTEEGWYTWKPIKEPFGAEIKCLFKRTGWVCTGGICERYYRWLKPVPQIKALEAK